MKSGKEAAEEVCCWIKGNRRNLNTLMHLVHIEVDGGNPCVQRGDVFSLARKAGMSISEANELKRDNNLWPGVSRYMVMLRPRLARSINFRKSKLDKVDLVEIWHDNVDAGTIFFAKDRFEAKRLCDIGDVTAQ